jgi:hypothetical protein
VAVDALECKRRYTIRFFAMLLCLITMKPTCSILLAKSDSGVLSTTFHMTVNISTAARMIEVIVTSGSLSTTTQTFRNSENG